MTYRLKLVVACLLLLAVTLAGIGFSFWSAGQLQAHLDRSRLAHLVLEGHLQLKARTYKLFKQFADAGLTGASLEHFQHPALRDTLLRDIAKLRDLITADMVLVDDEKSGRDETDQLRTIARVEQQILDVVREFEQVQRLIAGQRQEEARRVLDNTLEQSIDEEFDRLIRAAIDAEMAEVAAADEAAAGMARTVRWLSIGLGVAAIIVVTAVLSVLLTRFRQPYKALVAGTGRLSQGDLGHRIVVTGRDEFARLAQHFNLMAEQLHRHRDALTAAREDLERTVVQRTAELQAANAALQAADGARRQLFADISHELRTPLTVIRGEAEVTLRGRPKTVEEYETTLRRIAEQVCHTARLVDDLLFIARSQAGEPRLRMQTVALLELIERACAAAEALAAETGVRVEMQATVESAVVTGDPDRLRQALMIVIDNALRYSRPCATVRVLVGPSPRGVCVTVTDDGVGIPPDEVERVFERFYRASDADRTHPDGAGLGLPIAKAIIDAHGGEMSLSSEFGRGTRVAIFLPVSRRLQLVG